MSPRPPLPLVMQNLFLVLLIGLASACSSPRQTSGVMTTGAQEVAYTTPDGYSEVANQSTDGITLFSNERYHNGLFVATLPSEAARANLMLAVQERVARVAASGESQVFDWAPNTAPTGNQPASAYEVFNERRHGFNGESRIVVQFRQIRKDGRDLLTGYYYVSGNGAEAAQQFRGNSVGDSAGAGADWAKLVGSLIGEEPRNMSAPPPPAGPPPPGN